jgi:methyl-accepting chemotaxis protein
MNSKIVAVTLVVSAAIAGMAVLHYFAVDRYQSLGEIRVLVGDIHTSMLTLRRNEKDFLARRDLQYQQEFVDNYGQMLVYLKALRAGMQQNELEDTQLDQLATSFASYKDQFLAVVELQQEIGFNHQEGLYGSMREAIHQVEYLLSTQLSDRLSKDMLMLRRQEKDFMLRNDNSYVEKFDRDMLQMHADLASAYLYPQVKTQITTALANYEEHFKALASANEKKGFSSSKGLHGEMRNSVHRAEDILEALRRQSLQLINEAGSYVVTQIAAFAMALVLGMIVLVLFLPGRKYRKD